MIKNSRQNVIDIAGEEVFKDRNISYFYIMIEQCESLDEIDEILRNIVMRITNKIHNLNKESIHYRIRKALTYIERNYMNEINLETVADEIGVSASYLSRSFKQAIQQNFKSYVNDIRIEKAKALLKDETIKSHEVSEMVGIKDAHYFSRFFKKKTGLTPSEFKAMGNN